jgi:hypothetical protein
LVTFYVIYPHEGQLLDVILTRFSGECPCVPKEISLPR